MTRDQRLHFEQTALGLRAELVRAARRLAGGPRAEDLVQETLARALAAWHHVEPGSNARAWLHAILRHAFIDELRRSRREPLLEEPCEAAREADRSLAIDLDRAIAELPEPLRLALVAVDVEGCAYREAAARSGAPIGTVMSRLHRARRRMARRMAA
jgi:RNA polymerase sigma-70 factor (ECF subfamily)